LWEPLGHAVETSLKQQWLVAMGLGGYPTRPHEFGVRNPASPFVVPTRVPPPPRKVVGEPGFRLRFEVDPTNLIESPKDAYLFGDDERR